MVLIRQITPKELIENKGILRGFLNREFSLITNENAWMKDWEQLANRFQLFKFEAMSNEDIAKYRWNTALIEKTIQETIQKVVQYFPLENLNITVVPALPFPWFKDLNRSQWINGFTNGPKSIQIAVPPDPDIEFLQYLVAHEAHHAYLKNPIYELTLETFTLADWLKMEGTAEYFSLKLYKDKRWWKNNFTSEVEKYYWTRVKEHLKTTDTQIKGPFCFGDSSKNLPIMCGYSFGLRLIQSYMELYPENKLKDLFTINIDHLFSVYERNYQSND